MSIAAIVPIGDPRINGYGNVLKPCLRSISAFADMVILVQSHPAYKAMEPYRSIGINVNLISDEKSWFHGGRYDGKQIDKNIERGMKFSEDLGADVAVILSSNWYVPEASRAKLRQVCESTIGWGNLYRGDQLNDVIFSASKRLPMIVQIGSGYHYEFSSDTLRGGGMVINVGRGDYGNYNDQMIIDVPFEITFNNLRDKMNFCRCYADELPKRNPVFDWDFWNDYYLRRFGMKIPIDYQLDEYGKEIAKNSKQNYLSHHFLLGLEYETA